MKVYELIAQLSECDLDAEVVGGGENFDVCHVDRVYPGMHGLATESIHMPGVEHFDVSDTPLTPPTDLPPHIKVRVVTSLVLLGVKDS